MMELLLKYESKRKVIFDQIFLSLGIKRNEVLVLLAIQHIGLEVINLSSIRRKFGNMTYVDITKSIKKLEQRRLLKKCKASYDHRVVIIENIDYIEINNIIEKSSIIIKDTIQ